MNVKNEAIKRIRDKLEGELWTVTYDLRKNKREINKLANEQRIIKKKAVAIRELMKFLPDCINRRSK